MQSPLEVTKGVARLCQPKSDVAVRLADTATRGLTVSLKKAEVLCQSYPPQHVASATVMAGDTALESVDKFCYLGSTLANTVASDSDVTLRLAKAGIR